MCNFLSAIVDRTGKIYCLPEYTDSHTDLIEHYGLRGDTVENPIQHFVRVEFTPKGQDFGNLETWQFKVDEATTPSWFDEDMRYNVIDNLSNRIKRMLISEEKQILLGGCWILLDGANVKKVQHSRVVSMSGSSSVGTMYDSSRVGTMSGSSSVGTMYDSSRVVTMSGSSSVGTMYDSSRVVSMSGSSSVGTMYDSSRVGTMYDSSRVGTMYDSSRVGTMSGSSSVVTMSGSSSVGTMYDSSSVGTMYGSSSVGTMYDSSSVIKDKRVQPPKTVAKKEKKSGSKSAAKDEEDSK